jgi:hypothetical protein
MAHMQGRALVLTHDDPWVYAHNEDCMNFECYFETWSNCTPAHLEGVGAFQVLLYQ